MTEITGPAPALAGSKRDKDRRKELNRSGSPLFGRALILQDKYEVDSQKLRQLGSGTYGTVLTGSILGENTPVALKRMALPPITDGKARKRDESFVLRETDVYKTLGDHPNIIKLLDVRRDLEDNIYLVFPLVDNDLLGILSYGDAFHLDAKQIAGYMKDLFTALAHCHAHNVIHRDVKCENILVTADCQVKLADFGLAREMMTDYAKYTNPVQTLYGRAPELLLGSTNYDDRIDVWAAVCVVLQCVLRTPMLPGKSEENQLRLIYELCGTPRNVARDWPPELTEAISKSMAIVGGPRPNLIRARLGPEYIKLRRDLFTEELIQLVEAGLELNPSKRPHISELLTKPYFENTYAPELRFKFPAGQRTAKVQIEHRAKAHHEQNKKDKYHHRKK